MALTGISEAQRLEAVASTLQKMEELGHHLRELIATQPIYDLLGYIYWLKLKPNIPVSQEGSGDIEPEGPVGNTTDDTQILLEYIHSTLASTPLSNTNHFDEAVCVEIIECTKKLISTSAVYAMVSSGGSEGGAFGAHTADIEFLAKSKWLTLRGNRYMVLEGEFYSFVLKPHDAILHEVYGIGAAEIATGFQNIADSIRTGHSDAIDLIAEQFNAAQADAMSQGKSFEEISADWKEKYGDRVEMLALAFDDMLRGGICNVSRHTAFPPMLLADLAYDRGEEAEFYADGPYSGTPFRTLPVRKKPLIKLDGDYYAIDPFSIRDGGYRALLFNLLNRRPDYKKHFEEYQKSMSESAFFDILSDQLKDATVYQNVYYRDTVTGQWVENDTLIIIDDVLVLVEAKAGAAATVVSPSLDFERHVRSVQDLIVKAYTQCKRFFEYSQSADDVPLFNRIDRKYVECARLCRSKYRVMIPVGLTVESFSPFSTMCKELPDITPVLGKYPFLSIAIDDLFVLKRFLPTMGELAHYLEVRQSVAGMRGAHLFDEIDHLGAYITKNRFDVDIQESLGSGRLVIWDGMSDVVDQYFGNIDWEERSVPMQDFPAELHELLGALDRTRASGWLSADSCIRNLGEEGRNNFAHMLEKCRLSLKEYPERHFAMRTGDTLIFVFIQRPGRDPEISAIRDKASASALAAKAESLTLIMITAQYAGHYTSAKQIVATIPTEKNVENAHIYEAAQRMQCRIIA